MLPKTNPFYCQNRGVTKNGVAKNGISLYILKISTYMWISIGIFLILFLLNFRGVGTNTCPYSSAGCPGSSIKHKGDSTQKNGLENTIQLKFYIRQAKEIVNCDQIHEITGSQYISNSHIGLPTSGRKRFDIV